MMETPAAGFCIYNIFVFGHFFTKSTVVTRDKNHMNSREVQCDSALLSDDQRPQKIVCYW